MTNPHAARLPALVAEAKASAANVEHPWDRQAIDWPDLPAGATVIEVGGYKGRWALQMAERYSPRLFVFEPQLWAYETCKAALGDSATVLNCALGDQDARFRMAKWETDGCTFVHRSGNDSDPIAYMQEVGTTFRELEIDQIDLLLMNIEGYEYTLLPHMLDQHILPRRLVVQFHIFDDYGVGMGRLFDRLAAVGYKVIWTYGVVLTAWERD